MFGEVWVKTKISKNVRLEESPAYKETILTFAPKSPGALEYKKLAGEVIQRVEEDRVTRHAEDGHDAHYVESLTSYSGAAVGRMIPVERIRPNPDSRARRW